MPRQLLVGVLASECPFNPASRFIAPLFPRPHFRLQVVFAAEASSQALPIHDANFNLRHVQPTGMLGGVVKLNPSQELPGEFDAEDSASSNRSRNLLI